MGKSPFPYLSSVFLISLRVKDSMVRGNLMGGKPELATPCSNHADLQADLRATNEFSYTL